MKVTLTRQPYLDSASGASFLANAIGSDTELRRVIIASAWVRRSGLLALESELRALRARGGRVTMLVGVDLKGTTRQGLDLARDCTDSLFVVHDPEGRTFHPKLYLAYGGSSGYALVGSHNLTAGGLGFNYECGLACTFDPRKERDLVDEVDGYVRRLVKDKGVCLKVTPQLVGRLQREGWLADEERDRRNRDEDRTKPRGSRGGRSTPLFSGSTEEKRRHTPPRRADGRRRRRSAGRRGLSSRKAAAVALAPDRWAKQLGPGDAQRPPVGNATGVVRLTPPRGIPDRSRFFRHVFFATESWRRDQINGKPLDVTTIDADVVIGRRKLGVHSFKVDYADWRDVRGRATATLHWDDLGRDLRETHDVVGWYLLLERGAAGAYRITLTKRRPA